MEPVDLWVNVPCEHGETEQHRIPDEDSYLAMTTCSGGYQRKASDAEVIARLRQIEGVEEVEATRGLVQYKWRCGNCGTDHGEAGCDDPDLYDYTLYRMKPELEPGTYLVVPVPDSRKEK